MQMHCTRDCFVAFRLLCAVQGFVWLIHLLLTVYTLPVARVSICCGFFVQLVVQQIDNKSQQIEPIEFERMRHSFRAAVLSLSATWYHQADTFVCLLNFVSLYATLQTSSVIATSQQQAISILSKRRKFVRLVSENDNSVSNQPKASFDFLLSTVNPFDTLPRHVADVDGALGWLIDSSHRPTRRNSTVELSRVGRCELAIRPFFRSACVDKAAVILKFSAVEIPTAALILATAFYYNEARTFWWC